MFNSEISNINPFGFLFTMALGLLMLFLPRRQAVFPIIASACFITLGQVIVIGSLNFTMFRIIIFFGLVRILIRKEIFSIRWHSIDKVLIAYVITSAAAYLMLRKGSGEAITSQLGFIYNSLFLYAILRALIRDIEDIMAAIKIMALIAIPLALFMVIEKFTGRNLFSVFGGVPEFTMVRDGRIRAQGAFAHPILAGTFGATLLPLALALWYWDGGKKIIAAAGMVSAAVITVTPVSSGPAVSCVGVIIALAMWPLRENMKFIRWSIVLFLIGMHLIMKAPVWALIGRMSELVGGTGWHRTMLIDAAIKHFGEWWLFGTDYTRHWMPTGVSWSLNHTDITNQFIGVGIQGGVFALILFIALIVLCFKYLGQKLKELKTAGFPLRFTLWCLGASLLGHLLSFLSVRYFDQIIVFWYLFLAMIVAVSLIPAELLMLYTSKSSAIPEQTGFRK